MRTAEPSLEERRQNAERLEACPGHAFKLLHAAGTESSRARYHCDRCGGTLDAKGASWYSRGFADGQRAAMRARGDAP